MIKISSVLTVAFAMMVTACGEGVVSVTNESYESKIAIEGFLVPHQPVTKIRVARNFPIDANLRSFELLLPNAEVKLIDESSGREYQLTFHRSRFDFDSNYFEYQGDDLIIECGKSYTLEVTATIDGQQRYTRATTTVPQEGFRIVQVNYDSLVYRQRGENGEVLTFELIIERSPGTTFYINTVRALDASSATFVYDNPFARLEPKEVDEDLDDFVYYYDWLQDTPATAGQSRVDVFWFALWFYGRYEIITYAADRNYKEFLQTYNDVQEPDGNFHEPKFHFDGDGIGVFGSLIADTVYVKVLKD